MRVPTALGGAWMAGLAAAPCEGVAIGGAILLALSVVWTEVGR